MGVTASRAGPDFLIVGTMKGGTTVLYDFICMHERVKKATEKELHYFSLYPYKGIDWYMSHFSAVQGQITGEASPTYFDVAYTNTIPMSIRENYPSAKIIVITRNPVERAVSHFYHFKNINKVPLILDTDINEFFSHSFEDCITVTDNRNFLLQQILYFGAYARKSMFYKSVFGNDQILFLDNGDLRSSPRQTMEKVFTFLGLEPFYSEVFEGVRYSSGRTSTDLEPAISAKLSRFYNADYSAYAKISGLHIPPLVDPGA